MKRRLLLLLITGLLYSCHSGIKTGDELSEKDKKFLKELGILEDDEQIILFDSQSGDFFNNVRQSGNFFTNKRIATYWIDTKEKTDIHSAYYSEIDTMWRFPRYKSLTYASFLEVHKKDGSRFNVYVDADSTTTWLFFNRALEEWSTHNGLPKPHP